MSMHVRQPLLCTLLAAAFALLPAASAQAQKRMAVTIDDLPHTSALPADFDAIARHAANLVGCLETSRIPAVGFVNESRLYEEGTLDPRRVALLQRWLDAGLELGNHTFGHVSLNQVPFETFRTDFLRGEEITGPMAAAAGRPLRWFRPAYLHLGRTPQVRASLGSLLEERGYVLAPVTINNADWRFAAAYDRALAAGQATLAEEIASGYVDYMIEVIAHKERHARRLTGGGISHVLLLHANALNADHLCTLTRRIAEHGYSFVSLAEALQDPVYARPLPTTEWAGDDWLERWTREAGLPPQGEVAVPELVRQWEGAGSATTVRRMR